MFFFNCFDFFSRLLEGKSIQVFGLAFVLVVGKETENHSILLHDFACFHEYVSAPRMDNFPID